MLIQDYETVLEKVLEGLRIYAVHPLHALDPSNFI